MIIWENINVEKFWIKTQRDNWVYTEDCDKSDWKINDTTDTQDGLKAFVDFFNFVKVLSLPQTEENLFGSV